MSKQIVKSQDETVTWRGLDDLDEAIDFAGYSYDAKQDIFYSNMDPWQRGNGYCRLYDEAAAPFGMIIDSEPIYFEYCKKKWMIGFWKGQYDLVTGGEIGIYTEAKDPKIPTVFTGTFYESVSNADLLHMSYTLKKNGHTLFTREGTHWWLTGFKLGEFSEPSELEMLVNITLHNEVMRDAFVSGLRTAGYSDAEFKTSQNTVSFTFAKPHTRQPVTRTPATDWIIQKKNKLLCEKFLEVTKAADTLQAKVKAIEDQSPELYQRMVTLRKSKQLSEIYATILVVIVAISIIALAHHHSKSSS